VNPFPSIDASLVIGDGGSITLDGGSIHARGGLDNSSDGALNFRDGTLTVENGVYRHTAGGANLFLFWSGNNPHLVIGAGATATAIVAGDDSHWHSGGNLSVGGAGRGFLNIRQGGLVSVAGDLSIDNSGGDGGSSVDIAVGGMLALFGDADDSLSELLALIDGTDELRYWNATLANWDHISNATLGSDYTLEYLTTGELVGYTVLTVGESNADFDSDGDVDGHDFLKWQRGESHEALSADDLALLESQFGTTGLPTPLQAAAVSTPEPSTLLLGGIAGLLFCSRRR
jgi:T5SS/PEP-CTERM-associated repeat protein